MDVAIPIMIDMIFILVFMLRSTKIRKEKFGEYHDSKDPVSALFWIGELFFDKKYYHVKGIDFWGLRISFLVLVILVLLHFLL